MSQDTKNPKSAPSDKDPNLTEEILRQGGKTEEEVNRTGTIDRAEDDYEAGLAPGYRTANSPVHKAVWDQVSSDLFAPLAPLAPREVPLDILDKAVAIMQKHTADGTIYGADNKVPDEILMGELGPIGYWGLMIAQEFGGSGATVRESMEFMTEMTAKGNPSVAGLASVHGCIGAVNPISNFGTDEQKQKYLGKLAAAS